jgi:C-terminal processing protease CtpA/Prc
MRCLPIVTLLVLALASVIPTTEILAADIPGEELGFERAGADRPLAGWGGGPVSTIARDTVVVHSGASAARITRDASSEGSFTAITRAIPADFAGRTIVLRGVLKTEDVTGFAGLWMRQDGPGGPVQFDNMQGRNLRGTTDWTEYEIELPLDEDAREIYFGVLMSMAGTVWADDLEILVDGETLGEAPAREIEQTVLDTDTEFDDGSRIELAVLSPERADHVALLGRVWGFLKYHHPGIASGERHWDYELFRVLPRVLAASEGATCQRVIANWIEEIGVPDPCAICPEIPADAHFQASLDWLGDEVLLGSDLSRLLQAVYERRAPGFPQFYVTQSVNVGNPEFHHESLQPTELLPDAGYRILAVLRLWNIIEYWFPYRDLIDEDWPAVLRDTLPRIVSAQESDIYRLELMALLARVDDGHANLWTAIHLRPPRGDAYWPVGFRWIEDRLTVTSYAELAGAADCGLRIGDVLLAIGGEPLADRIARWHRYYAGSNERARLRAIAGAIPRGPVGPVEITIDRGGERRTLTVERVEAEQARVREPHDRAGDTLQMLSPDIAYLKLSSVAIAAVPSYIERIAGTRGLVIDIRNYPSEFVVFALGARLVDEATEFARFTVGDLANPGAFVFGKTLSLFPTQPGYAGQVAILVDESSLSQAEYTAMALRCGPRAVVVGSQTAGADGNVSTIPLPGGQRAMMSGIGVFYPDRTPTQQIGIEPDIAARPTRAGWIAGRDEVLEAALRHLLGPDADEAAIREIARWPHH